VGHVMTAEWKNTFRVGRYKVEMTYRHGNAAVKTRWEPYMPTRLSRKELQQYRDGRHALFEEVGKALGGPVLVIE
jgi:hypothetical protein